MNRKIGILLLSHKQMERAIPIIIRTRQISVYVYIYIYIVGPTLSTIEAILMRHGEYMPTVDLSKNYFL